MPDIQGQSDNPNASKDIFSCIRGQFCSDSGLGLALYHVCVLTGSEYERGRIRLESEKWEMNISNEIVSERPYKKALTHDEAVCIISGGKGSHFDPALIDIFIAVSDEFHKVTALKEPDEVLF